jgi:hypothetical protein
LLPLMQFYNNVQQRFLCSWCVSFKCITPIKWQVKWILISFQDIYYYHSLLL